MIMIVFIVQESEEEDELKNKIIVRKKRASKTETKVSNVMQV